MAGRHAKKLSLMKTARYPWRTMRVRSRCANVYASMLSAYAGWMRLKRRFMPRRVNINNNVQSSGALSRVVDSVRVDQYELISPPSSVLGVASPSRVRVCTRGLWTMADPHRLPCLPRLIGVQRATESILVSARRPFFALRRRKFVCRCLNTPAVRRVDGDPSRDTFGEVDELISHTSIRCFAIYTTAPSARERRFGIECISYIICFFSSHKWIN